MKTKILQLATVLLFTMGTARVEASSLNLRAFNNASFTVVFDGVAYTTPTTSFLLNPVMPGNHTVQLYAVNGYGPAAYQAQHLLAQSTFYIGSNTTVSGLLTQYGALQLTQTPEAAPVVYTYNQNGGYGQNYGDHHNGHGDNDHHNDWDHHANDAGGYYSQSNYNTGYTYGYTYNSMCPADFAALKQTIIAQWFDSGKQEVMKMAMQQNYFTSEQVRDLLNLLDFESSKLAMAKVFYNRTVDKQNYFRVYNAFSFQSSITELNHCLGI